MASNPLTAEMQITLSRKQLTFRPVDLLRFVLHATDGASSDLFPLDYQRYKNNAESPTCLISF